MLHIVADSGSIDAVEFCLRKKASCSTGSPSIELVFSTVLRFDLH